MNKENIEKEINEQIKKQTSKISKKVIFWILWMIKTILIFTFPYILAWLLLVIVWYIIFIMIMFMMSIDLANVPYFYTKQETQYNLPVISDDFIKKYATSTIKYDSSLLLIDEVKLLKPNEQVWRFFNEYKDYKYQTDLISNIYFYTDNQLVLSNILYPIRFLDIWDIKVVNGELYTKIQWEDFYYSFNWKEISRWLDDKELEVFNKTYKKSFWINTTPTIKQIISFADENEDNVKKQLSINRSVIWYWLSFDKVENDDMWLDWYYRITYYLDFWKDIKTQMVESIYNNIAYDMVIRALLYNISDWTTGEKEKYNEFITRNYTKENQLNNSTMENILSDYLENNKSSSIYWLYQCLKTFDISRWELSRTDICVNNKTTLASWKELNNFDTLNQIISKYNNDITLELINDKIMFDKVMWFIKENEDTYENTKNKTKQEYKTSNPYFWFYEKYDEFTWEKSIITNKIQLSPQTYLYSLNQMKNEWLDIKLWFDFKKEFLSTNNDWRNYRYSYGSIIENIVEEKLNKILSNNNNNFFYDFRKKYLPEYSLRKNTYTYSKNWDIQEIGKKETNLKSQYWENIQTFSKYWNYFVYSNYKENFDYYQIWDYYYLNAADRISENKDEYSKKYFNIYDINHTDNIDKENIYWLLTKDEAEPILYIDKWSQNSFQQMVNSSTRNGNKITKNSISWYLNQIYDKSQDPVVFTSRLDDVNKIVSTNDVSWTQYFYLFNWYADRWFIENTSYYIQRLFWTTLSDNNMNMIFNSYSMMLNNDKIEKQYDNLIIKNERNPFEFILYYYNRWDNDINLTDLIRKTIWKQNNEEQINIENAYAQYKDFWISFLKYYSQEEKTDIAVMISDIPWYCKKYDDEASCIKVLNLFKQAYNSNTNRTYYDNYMELKDIFWIIDDTYKNETENIIKE